MKEQLRDAILNHQPLPKFGTTFTLDAAYDFQRALVSDIAQPGPSGIKAGATNQSAQKFLGIEHALLGRLYPQGRLASNCCLPYLPGRIIELEIAVCLDGDGKPNAIAPAIEFVHLKFSVDSDMTAGNLVASNLGADQYIVGTPIPFSNAFEALPMTLSHNAQKVAATNSAEALGGPSNAAEWMTAEALNRGFSIAEETLFLTGACGEVVRGEVGDYVADFGQLGSISFAID